MSTNRSPHFFHILKRDTWLRPGLAAARMEFAKSLALGIIALLCAVGLMFMAGYLIACAAEQPLLGLFSLLVPVGFVQIFGIGRPFLNYLERLESHNWVLRISSNLRKRLFGALRHMRLENRPQTGEVLELLAGDVENLQNLFLRSFFPFACAVVLWLLLSLAMLAVHPLCALCFFVAGGVLCALVPMVAARMAEGAQAHETRCAQELAAAAYDGIEGIDDWRFAGRKSDYMQQTMDSLDAVAEANAAVERTLRRFELVEQCIFALTCVVVVAWAVAQFGTGADPAQSGFTGRPQDWACAISIGALALVEVITPLVRAAAGANVHIAALKRLNDIQEEETAEEPREAGKTSLPSNHLHAAGAFIGLELRAATFSYGGERAGRQVLEGISLRVAPGEKLAILGPSGSGKSTLLALMHGSLMPTGGAVCLNTSQGNFAPTELGSAVCNYISFIRQQNHLFSQTLFENLTLGDNSITRDEATEALKCVGLGALLESLPRGLDTLIGEGGRTFSGGQEQRIALARVLLRHAPVVLLDEPTSSLDPSTEHALIETMFETLADKTLVMVTHHLACIERFDRVVFLEGGHITMEGSPSELAATNARFQELLACDRGL